MAIKHVCSIYRPFLVLLPQKGGLKSMYMLQDFELGCSGVVKAACRYFSSVPFSVTPHYALGKVTRSLPSVSDKEISGLKCRWVRVSYYRSTSYLDGFVFGSLEFNHTCVCNCSFLSVEVHFKVGYICLYV